MFFRGDRRHRDGGAAREPVEVVAPQPAPTDPLARDVTSGDGDQSVPLDVLTLVERVIAPTSLLVALAYHFGREFTFSRASYFGLDASLYGFSSQEYVVRSLDPLFVPVGAVLLVSLVVLAVHRRLDGILHRQPPSRALRLLVVVLRTAGGLLLALGLISVFRTVPIGLPYWVPPASPAIGLASLAYANHLSHRLMTDRRGSVVATRTRAQSRVLVGAFVVLSLFWTATVYADALGRGRSEHIASSLDHLPGVTVFSTRALSLSGPSVIETHLSDPAGLYHFRYDGLRLIIRADHKLFLLPGAWTPTQGSVAVLSESAGLRFEFHR